MGARNEFRSKIDWWLVLLVLAVAFLPVARQWAGAGSAAPPLSIVIPVLVLGLLVIAFYPIRYVIDGRTVSVQCGLARWEYITFAVDQVLSVRPTHNPISSPALSLDRLRIELSSTGSVLISPADKAAFLSALSALDPQLQLLHGSLQRVAS